MTYLPVKERSAEDVYACHLAAYGGVSSKVTCACLTYGKIKIRLNQTRSSNSEILLLFYSQLSHTIINSAHPQSISPASTITITITILTQLTTQHTFPLTESNLV